MKKVMFLSGIAALIMSATAIHAASVEWVTGTVQFRAGSGAWQAVARGQNIPDNASIKTSAGSRVKVNFTNGRTAIVEAGREVGLSSLSGGASGVSSIASRFGTGGASSRVSSVAGTRAGDAAERTAVNPMAGMLSSPVEGEQEAIQAAAEKWAAGDLAGTIEVLKAFVDANPSAGGARYKLGVAYLLNENYADAAKELAVVIDQIVPGIEMTTAFWNYMVALQGSEEFAEASRVAQDAIDRYPTNINRGRWLIVRAQSELALGNEDAAQAALNEAARTAMEQVRLQMRDLTTATGLEKVVETVNGSPEVLMFLEEQEYILDIRRELMATMASN
jgi:TolA-binding protein